MVIPLQERSLGFLRFLGFLEVVIHVYPAEVRTLSQELAFDRGLETNG